VRQLKKVLIFYLVLALISFFIPQVAAAAGPLTALSDTMSRLQKSTVKSDHTIKFTTPTGVAAGQNIQITMPTGFAIGTVDYTDIDVSWGPSTGAENELTLAGTASGTTWGASFTGQVLTIVSGSGTITGTSKVIVEIGLNATSGDQQITNHATAGTYTISIAGSFTDTGKIAIVILDFDQFTISGTVDPTLSFSLDNTSTGFGIISTSSPTTSSPNIGLIISTNATSGYTISVHDQGSGASPGLYNSTASTLIASASADLGSVAGYGIQCSSASATCSAPYNVSGTNVGAYAVTAQNLATASGTADNHSITITSKAKAPATAPAGTYSDTVTLIATGNF